MPLSGGFGNGKKSIFTRGEKLFEVSNHLGNVLVTVTDRRQQVSVDGVTVDSYRPDIASASDYYPFGMLMPSRNYSAEKYRYGFNGKEQDPEVKGAGNQYDYGFRIYDPRIGKFLSVDPLTKKYPELTPYQFGSNRPMDGIDLDGSEWKKVSTYDPKTGVTNVEFQVKLSIANDSRVFKNVKDLTVELQHQFEASFKAASTEKVHYSAKIEVSEKPGPYTAILYDKQKGNAISGIQSGEPNTQANAVSIAAGKNADPQIPGSGNSRDIKLIAQDIIHEFLHTAGVNHPDDVGNKAEDVDVNPVIGKDANGKPTIITHIPGKKAKLNLIIHNIMIYDFKKVNGKKISEYESDAYKRGDISPDQAKIVSKQVDADTQKKH